jgi:hypothetical protein
LVARCASASRRSVSTTRAQSTSLNFSIDHAQLIFKAQNIVIRLLQFTLSTSAHLFHAFSFFSFDSFAQLCLLLCPLLLLLLLLFPLAFLSLSLANFSLTRFTLLITYLSL